jgi:hypothetical protein
LLDHLQQVIVYGDEDHKKRVLWLLNNVICNSHTDLIAVMDHGILANIVLAMKDKARIVRKEAYFFVLVLLTKL